MDFTEGLSIGLILGGIGGIVVGIYIFAKSIDVSESDTEQEIIQEPSRSLENAEPETLPQNKAQKYSEKKKRRRKGITGRSKRKRRRGG